MHSEKIDFGPNFGEVSLYQLSFEATNKQCAHDAASTSDDDQTGLMVYAGAPVAVRHMHVWRHLLAGKHIIELGCGVGAVSLVGCSTSMESIRGLCLTDGNIKPLVIARDNIQLMYGTNPPMCDKISCEVLLWGNSACIDALKVLRGDRSKDSGGAFDIVLGCELMYYNTDIVQLLDTVLGLTNNGGVFIHCHVFRKNGQATEMIHYFERFGWSTFELNHRLFLAPEELHDHPEWYKVRCLISGPSALVKGLCEGNEVISSRLNSWCPLAEDPPSFDDDDDEDDEDVDEEEISKKSGGARKGGGTAMRSLFAS